jgi:dihydropteroate synthase
MTFNSSHRVWRIGSLTWSPRDLPRLFGIVNVTPDSFSDGGKFIAPRSAVDHALRLVEDGADVLDIGGESTRPGSDAVSVDEELRRVIPVIERLASQTRAPISIDTSKSQVAREALQAGASIVNDISGLTFDPQMPEVCAASDCGVLVMHIRGTPKTMQLDPRYGDVVQEVTDHLHDRVRALVEVGIAPERVLLDPGIGFGKTPQHNRDLLRGLSGLQSFGRPVLIGHSRKRFISKIVGHPLEEREAGTVGVSIAAAQLGADYLRVHDIQMTRDALLAWSAIVNSSGLDDSD